MTNWKTISSIAILISYSALSPALAAENLYLVCDVTYTYRQYTGFQETSDATVTLEIVTNAHRKTIKFSSAVTRLNGSVWAGLSEREQLTVKAVEIIDSSTPDKWDILNRFELTNGLYEIALLVNRKLGRVDIRSDNESLTDNKWDSVRATGECKKSGDKNVF